MAAREDHVTSLEDLSPAEDIGAYRKQPTIKAREDWEEEHGHHVSTGEIHLLTRACHALVHERLKRSQLMSTETKDDDKHNEEARVVQNLTEKHRSTFENFDLRTQPKFVEDMVEERDGR